MGAASGLAAVAFVGLAGFPLASAFFTAAPRVSGNWAAGGVCVGRGGGTAVKTCRARPDGVAMMSYQGGDEDASKPQFIRSPEMDTSVKEIQQPPDREAAMKMVAAREAEEISRGELGAYYSADVPDMPKPPYQFQVPGEFGNDTLCTDPAWHTALAALTWLGLPYEVEHEEDEDEPMLLMGGEVYDDPMQLIASLPERVLLSDFVESMHQVTEAVLMVEPAWKALHFNEGKNVAQLEKKLNDTLQKVENIFLKNYSKGCMLEGADLTVGDLLLGVTTFHMVTAFGLEKQWKVPDELVKLKKHMAMMHGMQTLTAVMPSESDLAQKYALSK